MKWQDVSKIAKEKGFVEEYDESLECPVLDEDKVSSNSHRISVITSKNPIKISTFSVVDGPFGT